MLKLSPANHLALIDTLYTPLNNVRVYLFVPFQRELSALNFVNCSIKIKFLFK
jgi:hypothetical protein